MPDSASATVTIDDVLPEVLVEKTANPISVPETGDLVTFTVRVRNPAGAVENISASSVAVYTFTAGTDVIPTISVSKTAQDDEQNPVTARDSATAAVLNVVPRIVVDKLPSTGQVSEPGDTVNFTVTGTNPGTAEELTLTSLNDSVYQDLNGKGNCSVPQTIAPDGGQYSCTFPGDVKGDAGTTHTNSVTAVATDDDGSQVSDIARATPSP